MKKMVLLIFISFGIISCSSTYRNITTQMPDLTQINDGVYRGIYDLSGTPVKVTLDVFIQNNRINKIEIIEHRSSPIGKKAENILESVIARQNIEIDVVSGATVSSKAILKAIENALQ